MTTPLKGTASSIFELCIPFHATKDLNSFSKIFDNDEPDNSVTLVNNSHYFYHDSAIKLLKDHTNNFILIILFSTNIASIRTKFDKLTMFLDEFKENKVKFGAICLQETWLADDGTIHFSIYFSR